MEDPSLPQNTVLEIEALDGETFAGLPLLLRANAEQLDSFERWTAGKTWRRFHDEPSLRFGAAFRLSAEDASALSADLDFLARLDRSAGLVAASLGWNLREERLDESRESGRFYDEANFMNHGMRLRKMILSADLFGREETVRSLSAFVVNLRTRDMLKKPKFFRRYLPAD